MDIQITTKKGEGVERLLEVSVPVETVRDAEERTAKRYASQVRLPGFRPGKAPPAVVKRRFKDAIRQQVLEDLIQEAFKEVLEREKLKVASQPHVHDLHFHEGEPLTFELHLEVRPEINLARVEGFRLKRSAADVTDEQVQEQLERLREQQATWTPTDDRPMSGDMVTVELATADDGDEIGEGKEYRIVLGEGQAIPGIEELAMELTPGQTIERPVRWPDDFPDESQRGTTKPVRLTLRETKRKSLPALDDALARSAGDFESLDDLRQRVREDLEQHAKRDAEAALRQQLLDRIVEANPFEVPPSWVAQMAGAYLQGYGIPDEQRDQFAEQFRPIAERQVRRDLIVETIAEREKLTATEADLDDRIAEMAQKRGVDVGQLYAQLQKAGRLKEMEHALTEEKVFDWLLARNTVD